MTQLKNILAQTDCLTQEQIMAYLENKLSAIELHEVENHIADCMLCSEAIEGLQNIAPQEIKSQLAEIDDQLNDLLFADEPKEQKQLTPKHLLNPTLKPKPKTISWRAAAAIFILIFVSSLVVFSYINNNTSWLKSSTNEMVINEKPTKNNENNAKSNEQLVNKTIQTDENEIAKLDQPDNNKKVPGNVSEQKALPNPRSVNEPIITRAEKMVPARPMPPSPITEDQAANIPLPNPTKSAAIEAEKAVFAKAEIQQELDQVNAGARNTYSQPLYQGKLKEVKKIEQTAAVVKKNRQLSQNNNEEAAVNEVEYKMSENNQASKLYTKGITAFKSGNYKESVKSLKRALRTKDFEQYNDAMYYLALSYEKMKEYSKAQKLYEELLNDPAYEKQVRMKLNSLPSK